MKKSEILHNYQLSKLDDKTVFIKGKDFNFSYTKADDILKEEFKGKYRYFGGLQSNLGKQDEYLLEDWLCDLAEQALKIRKDYSIASDILKKYEDDNEYHIHNVDRKFVLEAMEEYADQCVEVVYNLFNTPSQILTELHDIYRKENPIENNQFYIPDTSEFYKWIVNKIKA